MRAPISTRPRGTAARRLVARASSSWLVLLGLAACPRRSPPVEPGSDAAPVSAHAEPQAEPLAGEDAVVAWVDRQLVPLATTDPAASLDELRALDPYLQGRQVIALGEATHGTREFFRLKHRLFRYLAERHGYTVLALELPFATAARIDDYVHGGPGDPYELVRGSYWFMGSEEIVALIVWMREHNARAEPSRQLELVGFDVQRARASAEALAELLASAAPALAAERGATLARLAKGEPGQGDAVAGLVEEVERLRQALDTLPALDPRARGHLDVVAQDLDIRRHCGDAFGCQVVKRDVFMAANVLRSLAGPAGPKRAVVWAHNGHVGRAVHPDGWPPMGSHLAAELGSALYVVGFEFDHGGFVAPAGGVGQRGAERSLSHLGGFRVAEYELPPAPAGSLAHALARASAPLYFLPLDQLAEQPEVAAWLREHPEHHEYGAFVPSAPRHTTKAVRVEEAFDAIVFVEETRAYRLVEGG